MEQRWSQEKTQQKEHPWDQREQSRHQPEREGLSGAGQLARAVQSGLPLWELPPGSLEELAGWIGNQGMNALLAAQTPGPAEAPFLLPSEEVETAPFSVPAVPAESVAPPVDAAAEIACQAFDPAGLTVTGGGADGSGMGV